MLIQDRAALWIVKHPSPRRNMFWVSFVYREDLAVEPVIPVALEEISLSVGPSENRVNIIRNTTPKMCNWSGINWVYTQCRIIESVIIGAFEEICFTIHIPGLEIQRDI